MRAYIKSGSVISPQQTFDSRGFPADIQQSVTNRLTCLEPDYRNLINPMQLRRMPRILKMGLATAQTCINGAGGVNPEGIIVGTGLGCLDNLEKFMMEVIDKQEHVTSVLPFINSTHNAVAAQIAMLLKNQNYNITYCHRGFSFESALQDALMLIGENQARHVLVGGIDECTDDFTLLHSYLHDWKEPLDNLMLFHADSPGTIAGEGAAFYILSADPGIGKDAVALEDVHTFFTPANPDISEIGREIDSFLKNLNMHKKDVEGVLLGVNGDNRFDAIYYSLQKEYFAADTDCLCYKHLCGEYYTSVAFALWLGSTVVNHTIPGIIKLNKGSRKSLNNLLIYNQVNSTEHSLILLNYGRL